MKKLASQEAGVQVRRGAGIKQRAGNSWHDWQVVGEMVRGVEGRRNRKAAGEKRELNEQGKGSALVVGTLWKMGRWPEVRPIWGHQQISRGSSGGM